MGVPDIMIWLADAGREALVASLGTGPQAARFEGLFAQPIGEGLISVVFLTGQALCRNHVAADPSHSDSLDQLLGQHTQAMVVAPLRFGDSVAGVISCAAVSPLANPQPPRAFEAADLREIEFLAACVSRVLSCDSRS
jgi:GAF domain-containing protein